MKKVSIALSVAVVLIVITQTYKPQLPHKQLAAASYTFTQTQTATDTVRLLFVGDIMLGRYVETLSRKDKNYPFSNVSSLLSSSDAVIANLEGPIPDQHKQTPSGSVRFSFTADAAEILAQNRINIVTLANNHAFDQGEAGLSSTRSALGAAGILYFGHPTKISDRDVIRVTIKNKNFVFIGIHATDEKTFSIPQAVSAVKKMAIYPDDIVIAFVHAGTEYELHSSQFQRDLYHSLIDEAGVDAVIGAHPHVVQEVEEYQGKPIFYSLGNFVFDQYFSDDVQKGLAVQFTYHNDDFSYELIPLQSSRSQPYVLSGAKKEVFLKDLANR